MIWPFRRHHRPEDAPAVAEAREERDRAFEALDHAIAEVDRLHDRVVADYENAEQERLQR